MVRHLIIGLFLLNSLFSFSQDTIDFYNYKPLICKGEIPVDFKTELSNLVNEEKERQANSNRKEKKQAVNFSELSNYQLNNILYSGKVLYGDAMTDYVNKVADIILKKEPELRGKIRFYILKNTELNAYSTQRGIIFISIGLLAQIESEAQLAFILCHEIIHFRNNHNLEAYKNSQTVFEGNNGLNVSNRIQSVLNYSKESELEADREGLDLFLETPYGTNELNNLFDVLLYSYLPFDEIAFDTLYFNKDLNYTLPREYFLTKVSDISAEEDVSDSMSTHPNIRKRRETIQKLLESGSNPSGKSFIQPESEFNKVQRIARYEMAIVYMQDSDLEEALYNGYLIEKIYGRSLFSDKIIGGALYAKSKQRSNDSYKGRKVKRYASETIAKEESGGDIEGESQVVFYFLYKIPANELSILAARQLFEYNKRYKDDFFANRFRSIIYDLVNTYDLEKSSFYKEFKPDTVSDTKKTAESDSELKEAEGKTSKVTKIKRSQSSNSSKKEKHKDRVYYKYAFVNFYNDSLLDASFDFFEKKKKEETELTESDNYQKYKREKLKVTDKYGQALDINKMVLINPFFAAYVLRSVYEDGYQTLYYSKDPKTSPIEEEAVEHHLAKDLQICASELNMNVTIIGGTQQAVIETEKFNEFQQLINWFSERVALGKMGAYTFNDQYMDHYIEEYGYIGYCSIIKKEKALEMVFVLFNLETGGSEMIYEKELNKGRPDGVLVKMMLYDILHQISQKPNRINKLKKKYKIDG